MPFCYTLLQTRSQAFILERRLKGAGVPCELTFMPRELMKDLCNLGVRFNDRELPRAKEVIRSAGLPGCRLYMEIQEPYSANYEEILF